MRIGWVMWANERLWLRDRTSSRELKIGPIRREEARDLGFAVGNSWLVAFRRDEQLECWSSTSGEHWQPLPRSPVNPPDLRSIGLHPAMATISVVNGSTFWIGRESGWSSSTLPEGAIVVAPSYDGTWWAGGSADVQKPGEEWREAALWNQRGPSGSWVSVQTNPSSWKLALGASRLLSVIGIDADAFPVLVAAEGVSLIDLALGGESSSFALVERGSHFQTTRLDTHAIFRLARGSNRHPRLYTMGGEVLEWTRGRWNALDLAKKIANLFPDLTGMPRTVHLSMHSSSIAGLYICHKYNESLRYPFSSDDAGLSWWRGDLSALNAEDFLISTWVL